MAEKTTRQFIKEMKQAFGADIAIQVRLPDGTVFKQTDNWIDEAIFLKAERLRKQALGKNNQVDKEWVKDGYARK